MTGRTVAEWIGKSPDSKIPVRVRVRVFQAQDGICRCGCGVKMAVAGEGVDYDHIIALINGGENREGNVQALRRPCHKVKTASDVAEKSITKRKRAKHIGADRPKRKMPYRRFNGEIVWPK